MSAAICGVYFDQARTRSGTTIPHVAALMRATMLSAALGNDSADLMIAATALEHGLTVVTRNVSDFEPTGAGVLDPFSRRPNRK